MGQCKEASREFECGARPPSDSRNKKHAVREATVGTMCLGCWLDIYSETLWSCTSLQEELKLYLDSWSSGIVLPVCVISNGILFWKPKN